MRYGCRASRIVFWPLCLGLVAIACRSGPGDEQKRWALAATALLTEYNQESHDVLEGVVRTQENIARHKMLLNYWWGIDSREHLLFLLEWVEQIGHRKRFDEMGRYMNTLSDHQFIEMLKSVNKEDRSSWETVFKYWSRLGAKSLIGWDFCRYIHLCRRGYLLGYLSEKEAWDLIMPKAQLLQRTFDSWWDLGENYLIGREFWSFERTEASGEFFSRAFEKLLKDQISPWNTIPWRLDLQ
ncbi:DUF1266 domain-containing protein [candidate division WOR-3 bacterium]|nr:DUF1266 domain-containing protein [candidate division WOR-3 bacterium]